MRSASWEPPLETGETWSPIDGHENYLVSNLGRVFSKGRGIVLRPVDNGKGYAWVALTGQAREYVHRLVAHSFHGPGEAGDQAAHLNGVRSDNRAVNLAWVSCATNHSHKVAHGTHNRGERNSRARLTAEIAVRIIERVRAGDSNTEIAAAMGVPLPAVSDIARGKTWASFSGGGPLRSKEQIAAIMKRRKWDRPKPADLARKYAALEPPPTPEGSPEDTG